MFFSFFFSPGLGDLSSSGRLHSLPILPPAAASVVGLLDAGETESCTHCSASLLSKPPRAVQRRFPEPPRTLKPDSLTREHDNPSTPFQHTLLP